MILRGGGGLGFDPHNILFFFSEKIEKQMNLVSPIEPLGQKQTVFVSVSRKQFFFPQILETRKDLSFFTPLLTPQ